MRPLQMDTHLRVLSKSYPMNTNMTGFRRFFENLCVIIVLWMNVVSAMEGGTVSSQSIDRVRGPPNDPSSLDF